MSTSGDRTSRLTHALGAELGGGPEWTPDRLERLSLPELVVLCENRGISAPDALARVIAQAEVTASIESIEDEPV